MDGSTQVTTEKKPRRSRVGRTGKDKQEQVIVLEQYQDREEELLKLYRASCDASKDFSDAINACAEKSGMNASAIRKHVIAKAGDNYDTTKRVVTQLALLFDVE